MPSGVELIEPNEHLSCKLLLHPEITKQDTIHVSALHAFAYCPRLFYLEELYTQDAAVFAGRRLHAELEKQEDEEWEKLFLESK